VAGLWLQQFLHHRSRRAARLRRVSKDVQFLTNPDKTARPTVRAAAESPREEISMRAICGAIITAGAVIGLGLTALGIGTRYQIQPVPIAVVDGKTMFEPSLVLMHQMDRPLIFILVFLTCVAIVGLGIAFVGLAYHHHRRHHELLLARERATGPQRSAT
jgi:hypothetical protein